MAKLDLMSPGSTSPNTVPLPHLVQQPPKSRQPKSSPDQTPNSASSQTTSFDIPSTVYNHPSPTNSLSPPPTEAALSFEIFAPVGSIDPFATESAATVAMNMAQNSVASQAMNGGLFQPSLPFDDTIVQSWQSLTNPDGWNDISMPGKHCLYLQIFGPNLSPLNSDVGFNWMTQFQQNLGMDLSGVNASYDDDNVFMTGPTKH